MRTDLVWDSYWGQTDLSLIEEFEKRIGRKFPPSYKEIVVKHNGAFSKGKDAFRFFSNLTRDYTVYGLGLLHAYGNVDSVTETMEWSWRHKPEFFPDGLVSFSRDGGGNLICFDYRADPATDNPPIVVWHHEGRPGTSEEISPVANSFDEFLDMLHEE